MAVELKDLVIKRWKTKWTAKTKIGTVWVTYSVSTKLCQSVQEFVAMIEARKPFDDPHAQRNKTKWPQFLSNKKK